MPPQSLFDLELPLTVYTFWGTTLTRKIAQRTYSEVIRALHSDILKPYSCLTETQTVRSAELAELGSC